MGSVNEQYARAARVSADTHIDGLKEGDDAMPEVEETEAAEVIEFGTEAPETEQIEPEQAVAMSASSVTVSIPEDGDGESTVSKVEPEAQADIPEA